MKPYVVLNEPQLFARVVGKCARYAVMGDKRFEFSSQVMTLNPVGHVAAI